MGGLEPPTPGFRSRCAAIAPHPVGTDGRIRTDTDGVLSAVPLPLGYVSVVWSAGFEPASSAWRAEVLALGRRPRGRSVNQAERGNGYCRVLPLRLPANLPVRGVLLGGGSTPVPAHRIAMDTREGFAPSSRGLQPRASLLGHRVMTPSCCQGGARTPTFRVTTGRLALRLPGIAWYRDGELNPGLRVEGPASSPLDHRGVEEAVGLAPTRASWTPTCFRDRPLIWPDRFRVGLPRWHDSNVRHPPSEGGALIR